MSTLSSVKTSQRVSNNAVDEDFQEYIDACKNELLQLGVSYDKVSSEDAEIVQACKLFVHWMTDYEQKGDAWGTMYTNYVNALRQRSDYTEETDV